MQSIALNANLQSSATFFNIDRSDKCVSVQLYFDLHEKLIVIEMSFNRYVHFNHLGNLNQFIDHLYNGFCSRRLIKPTRVDINNSSSSSISTSIVSPSALRRLLYKSHLKSPYKCLERILTV